VNISAYLRTGIIFKGYRPMSEILKTTPNFYCGTSNVVLPVPNKGHFPPEYQDRSRLCYYASLFNTVEINSTFYKIPMPRTVEKWATEVPDEFRFTFKLWGGITHAKELSYDEAGINKFMSAINMAGDKKGCLLVQFPASIKISYFHKLKSLLGGLQAAGAAEEWKLAIEFRDRSWYRDDVYELLEQYSAAVVIHDMPNSITPLISMEADFVYMRFHGERGDYRGSYTDDLLQEQAAYIKDYLDEGKSVYVYFNNTMGEAVHNAAALNNF